MTHSLDAQIMQDIDHYLDEHYDEAKGAGQRLSNVGLGMAQIRGLENLIAATTRFSEIINYIKNQAGKEKGDRRQWRDVAKPLLDQLTQLEADAGTIGGQDPGKTMVVKLRLAKGWGKQVITHYLYAESLKNPLR